MKTNEKLKQIKNEMNEKVKFILFFKKNVSKENKLKTYLFIYLLSASSNHY